jgi:small conductance mechanosensitive channel
VTTLQYITIGAVVLVFGLAAIIVRLVHALIHRVLESNVGVVSTQTRKALHARAELLTRVLTLLAFGVAAIASVSIALSQFGINNDVLFDPRVIATHGIKIVIIVIGSTIVVRTASLAIEYLQHKLGPRNAVTDPEWQRRASTIGGILTRLMTFTVVFVAILMTLRELSIDVVPILTGAGLAGLAVGFGAQNLVRDVISGFFIILEDQVRVGDLARINNVTGHIEEINLRTILLRDGEGAVQVFPNGSITALANLSKHFAYAVVDVRVAYSEDMDRVMGMIREVGESLKKDTDLGSLVIGTIEILGVESIDNGTATVRSRFKALPLNQGRIANELRRRMLASFVAEGVRPFAPPRR